MLSEPGMDLLVDFLIGNRKTVSLGREMTDDEAIECMRVICADPDQSHRDFAYGALSVAASVTLRFPGPRAQRFMSEVLRMLRERAPWGDSEDHR